MTYNIIKWRDAVLSSDLKSAQKVVLLTLQRYADAKTGECWPAAATIAGFCGVSRPTVHRTWKPAEKAGLLKKLPGFNHLGQRTSNRFTLTVPPSEEEGPGRKKAGARVNPDRGPGEIGHPNKPENKSGNNPVEQESSMCGDSDTTSGGNTREAAAPSANELDFSPWPEDDPEVEAHLEEVHQGVLEAFESQHAEYPITPEEVAAACEHEVDLKPFVNSAVKALEAEITSVYPGNAPELFADPDCGLCFGDGAQPPGPFGGALCKCVGQFKAAGSKFENFQRRGEGEPSQNIGQLTSAQMREDLSREPSEDWPQSVVRKGYRIWMEGDKLNEVTLPEHQVAFKQSNGPGRHWPQNLVPWVMQFLPWMTREEHAEWMTAVYDQGNFPTLKFHLKVVKRILRGEEFVGQAPAKHTDDRRTYGAKSTAMDDAKNGRTW